MQATLNMYGQHWSSCNLACSTKLGQQKACLRLDVLMDRSRLHVSHLAMQVVGLPHQDRLVCAAAKCLLRLDRFAGSSWTWKNMARKAQHRSGPDLIEQLHAWACSPLLSILALGQCIRCSLSNTLCPLFGREAHELQSLEQNGIYF